MLLIYLDQDQFRYSPIAAVMLLTVAVAAPFGLALSALLARELEGTLILLVVVGLQMMLDPGTSLSRLLPFWFTREIGTYAVDHVDRGYLRRGLLQAAIMLVVLMVAVTASAGARLRRRSHLSAV